MSQVLLHTAIDGLVSKTPHDFDVAEVSDLISKNKDAKDYFFAKADERWVEWLWENAFLDDIKSVQKDDLHRFYQFVEIAYLARIAAIVPGKVTEIILSLQGASYVDAPQVLDRILSICASLPADQIARLTPKILHEEWVRILGSSNRWGFEFEKMLQTLLSAKKFESLLELAEAILAVPAREEFITLKQRSTDSPFYFNDLSYTKVFDYLSDIPEEFYERAVEVTSNTVRKIMLLGGEADSGDAFPIKEAFYLFDVDIFKLELGQGEYLGRQNDVRELIASLKKLICHVANHDTTQLRAVYDKYLLALPKTALAWRFKVFVFSLQPTLFVNELRSAFFWLFDVVNSGKSYYQIESPEYLSALKGGFSILSADEQRRYVQLVFETFGKKAEEERIDNIHKRDGWRILSIVSSFLSGEELSQCESLFGRECDPEFEPEPLIGRSVGGTVHPRGPINGEEFASLSIEEIAGKMRTEWNPEVLRSQNSPDDFLRPLNAEGVGDLLRSDMPKRLQDYIDKSNLFFERSVLDQHYTYSFLRGLQETIKSFKDVAPVMNWDGLFVLLGNIVQSDKVKSYQDEAQTKDRDSFDFWRAGWDSVHSSMADVVEELMRDRENISEVIFANNRDQLLAIVDYLLSYPDPIPADEKIETATSKTKSSGDAEYKVTDPFTMAINSVRGKAFEAFTLFVYQDGKKFSKGDASRISIDVKQIYERVLAKEDTRAIMFLFGRYVVDFYFRDVEWTRGNFEKIFSEDPEKYDLYTAAWEGYLSNNLYETLFFDPFIQKLYQRGLLLDDEHHNKQKQSRDSDEGIANHLALAFMYYKDFGFNNPLFKELWASPNEELHASFVSFLGRMFVSGKNESADKLLKTNAESRKRLIDLWDWMLESYKGKKPFVDFGFWINLDKQIFELSWLAQHVRNTLEKTDGSLDWDHGLVESIVEFAKVSPADTIAIIRKYVLEAGVRQGHNRTPVYLSEEWIEALRVLRRNDATKDDVYRLVDELIVEGGSAYWKLKDVLIDG